MVQSCASRLPLVFQIIIICHHVHLRFSVKTPSYSCSSTCSDDPSSGCIVGRCCSGALWVVSPTAAQVGQLQSIESELTQTTKSMVEGVGRGGRVGKVESTNSEILLGSFHSHRQATWQCLHQRTAEEISSCEFQTSIRANNLENDIHNESITIVTYHCIRAVIILIIIPVDNVHTTSVFSSILDFTITIDTMGNYGKLWETMGNYATFLIFSHLFSNNPWGSDLGHLGLWRCQDLRSATRHRAGVRERAGEVRPSCQEVAGLETKTAVS